MNLTYCVTRYNEDCKDLFTTFSKSDTKLNILVSDNGNINEPLYLEDEIKQKHNYKRIPCNSIILSASRLNAANNCETEYLQFVDADDNLILKDIDLSENLDVYFFIKKCIKTQGEGYQVLGICQIWNMIWKTSFIKDLLVVTDNCNEEELPTLIKLADIDFTWKLLDDIVYIYNKTPSGMSSKEWYKSVIKPEEVDLYKEKILKLRNKIHSYFCRFNTGYDIFEKLNFIKKRK